MADEGEGDELAVADLVDDHAADDDAEAEAREAGAADGTELGGVEAVFGRPGAEDAATEGEAYARSKDGHEACPKEALRVGYNGGLFVGDSTHIGMVREGVRL
ncbi:MAG: hypothetical protein CAK89_01210 [Opitutia bacterium AMD-G3]|nr:MAG: hypothetical protein CAK89_01210 [Opitutae bacterium AMD-G3]